MPEVRVQTGSMWSPQRIDCSKKQSPSDFWRTYPDEASLPRISPERAADITAPCSTGECLIQERPPLVPSISTCCPSAKLLLPPNTGVCKTDSLRAHFSRCTKMFALIARGSPPHRKSHQLRLRCEPKSHSLSQSCHVTVGKLHKLSGSQFSHLQQAGDYNSDFTASSIGKDLSTSPHTVPEQRGSWRK